MKLNYILSLCAIMVCATIILAGNLGLVKDGVVYSVLIMLGLLVAIKKLSS